VTRSLAIVIGEYKAGGAGVDRSEKKIWKNVNRQAGNIRVYVAPPRLNEKSHLRDTCKRESQIAHVVCVWHAFPSSLSHELNYTFAFGVKNVVCVCTLH
jgi:hypothetical protein